jgi:ankyrin repeat protein
MVEYLLNKGSCVDTRDRLLRTPLHLACLGGNSVIAKMLLEFKADPFERDSSGRTSMHYACCTGSVVAALELTMILCQRHTDLVHMKDHTGRTPLHYAIFN